MIPAVLISSMMAVAVSPPAAFVQGPEQATALSALVELLEDRAWKAAELRMGERSSGKRVLFVGQNEQVREAFRGAGWRILTPPCMPAAATVIFHLAHLSGNELGMRRAVLDQAKYLKRGGFFIVPPAEYMPDEFSYRLKASVGNEVFQVWQKQSA